MLDLKKIRENPSEIEKKLKTKDPEIDLSPILKVDEEIRKIQTKSEELKSQRNQVSKEIGIKKEKDNFEEMKKKMKDLGNEISNLDKEFKELKAKRDEMISFLPNIPKDDVPISLDPSKNVCIKTFKEKTKFSFKIKNHLELNEKLKLFDFQKSAKISGSSWPLYTNLGARLEWALLNYMIDTHLKNGFIQIMPPLLCKEEIMYGSGQLPKFKEQLFKIKDEDYNLFLIPTAEVVLNGLYFDTIIDEKHLPLKYLSYTPCFRREAGGFGKNERGLIRTHQFNKVELFSFSSEEESKDIFLQMLKSIEEVLEGLDIHYRNMLLVTKDTSFASSKTIDIEVWLPGQNRYYEVSSLSDCTDFQARRSLIRYKKDKEKPKFVHTLNGSGVATSRLMVSLLENNQKEDGSIEIPKVLHKYLEKEITTLTPL